MTSAVKVHQQQPVERERRSTHGQPTNARGRTDLKTNMLGGIYKLLEKQGENEAVKPQTAEELHQTFHCLTTQLIITRGEYIIFVFSAEVRPHRTAYLNLVLPLCI